MFVEDDPVASVCFDNAYWWGLIGGEAFRQGHVLEPRHHGHYGQRYAACRWCDAGVWYVNSVTLHYHDRVMRPCAQQPIFLQARRIVDGQGAEGEGGEEEE